MKQVVLATYLLQGRGPSLCASLDGARAIAPGLETHPVVRRALMAGYKVLFVPVPDVELREINPECEAFDDTDRINRRRDLGVEDPYATDYLCLGCSKPLPVACRDCTEYAIDAVRAPRDD